MISLLAVVALVLVIVWSEKEKLMNTDKDEYKEHSYNAIRNKLIIKKQESD